MHLVAKLHLPYSGTIKLIINSIHNIINQIRRKVAKTFQRALYDKN